MNVAGRKWINCDGQENFPDGEIFTSPIEDSANGVITYTYPACYAGREVENVQLTFKNGVVTDFTAGKNIDFLREMLNIDEGARRIGEFAIGTNYHIQTFSKNTLFDEKIGGTCHMAVGNSTLRSRWHQQIGHPLGHGLRTPQRRRDLRRRSIDLQRREVCGGVCGVDESCSEIETRELMSRTHEDSSALEALALELRGILEELTYQDRNSSVPGLTMFWKDDRDARLSDKGLGHYHRFFAGLFERPPFGTLVSRRFVYERLAELAWQKDQLLNDDRMVYESVDALRKEAEAAIRDWIVYMPIDGVRCELSEPVGFGNVQLLQITDDVYGSLRALADETYQIETGKDPRFAHFNVSGAFATSSMRTRSIRNSGAFCIPVRSEKGMAPKLAVPPAEKALHILTYLALVQDQGGVRPSLAFRKETNYRVRCAVMSTDKSAAYWEDEGERPSADETLLIDAEFITRANEDGLEDLQRFCSSSEQSPLERVMSNALRWLHLSTTDRTRENEFTSLMKVLEIFLNPEGDERIANAVAEGTALILGNEFEERREIKKHIRELYRIRNKIVHGTSVNQQELGRITKLRYYAANLVRILLIMSPEWQSLDDIRAYLEYRKLS